MWVITCFTVFYVIDGLATRPLGVKVEKFREVGMTDEQVLSLALQRANEVQANRWWINNREAYLVFDTTRNYQISQATYSAFDLHPGIDASDTPIAVRGKERIAGMRAP